MVSAGTALDGKSQFKTAGLRIFLAALSRLLTLNLRQETLFTATTSMTSVTSSVDFSLKFSRGHRGIDWTDTLRANAKKLSTTQKIASSRRLLAVPFSLVPGPGKVTVGAEVIRHCGEHKLPAV